MGVRTVFNSVVVMMLTSTTYAIVQTAEATVVSSRDGRQLQAAAAAAKAANVFLNGRIDGAYGDSSFCHNPRRSFITVTTARNTRQKVVAFIPNNQCGVQFYRKQYKYLALRPYASLTMLLNGGSVGGQAPLLFGITDSKGRMYQAPLAGYLPKGRLPARKWVRVTVPWNAFPGLKPKTVQMHSVWLKVNKKAKQAQMYVDGIQLLPAVSPSTPTPSPATLPPKTPAPTTPTPTTPVPATPQGTQRLHTVGNSIFTADGARWRVRGVNVGDPRMNTQCGPDTLAAATAEVMRRIDAAVAWGATFLRLPLETAWYDGSDDGLAPDGGSYRDAIQSIAQHVGEHPGVYIMISLFQDASFTKNDPPRTQAGWPTAETNTRWQRLVPYFQGMEHVLFGVVNEPASNDYANAEAGDYDAACWSHMNAAVAAIRAAEKAAGDFPHLVAVQGTHGWARVLKYYKTNPITADGGVNVIYETHIYNHAGDFNKLLTDPASVLPVIIGEMGPAELDGEGQLQSIPEAVQLMQLAESLDVPWLAWSFSEQNDPSMLLPALVPAGQGSYGCHVTPGTQIALEPNAWGRAVKGQLQTPWGA